MVYDSRRNRVVLFGGNDGGNMLGDTWEWDGSRRHIAGHQTIKGDRAFEGVAAASLVDHRRGRDRLSAHRDRLLTTSRQPRS